MANNATQSDTDHFDKRIGKQLEEFKKLIPLIKKKYGGKWPTIDEQLAGTKEGLLIRPLKDKQMVYFENKQGFGLYCDDGVPVDDIVEKIKKIHESN